MSWLLYVGHKRLLKRPLAPQLAVPRASWHKAARPQLVQHLEHALGTLYVQVLQHHMLHAVEERKRAVAGVGHKVDHTHVAKHRAPLQQPRQDLDNADI